jgi:hypothetical protein
MRVENISGFEGRVVWITGVAQTLHWMKARP